MHNRVLVAGQAVTKEAVQAALVAVLRERGVVKVRVACTVCGAETSTWIRPADEVVPAVWCYRCQEEVERG